MTMTIAVIERFFHQLAHLFSLLSKKKRMHALNFFVHLQ